MKRFWLVLLIVPVLVGCSAKSRPLADGYELPSGHGLVLVGNFGSPTLLMTVQADTYKALREGYTYTRPEDATAEPGSGPHQWRVAETAGVEDLYAFALPQNDYLFVAVEIDGVEYDLTTGFKGFAVTAGKATYVGHMTLSSSTDADGRQKVSWTVYDAEHFASKAYSQDYPRTSALYDFRKSLAR